MMYYAVIHKILALHSFRVSEAKMYLPLPTCMRCLLLLTFTASPINVRPSKMRSPILLYGLSQIDAAYAATQSPNRLRTYVL